MRTLLLTSLVLLCFACDPVDPQLDAGPTLGDAASGVCETAADCDDGVFCNGLEQCDESAPGDGCVAGAPPCEGEQVCAENEARCITCDQPDADGDGVDAIACGGSDCDDTDPNRFPGNVEVCDGEVDEDCDPTTLGNDFDNDGHVDAACCNRLADGELSCGGDCDDTMSGVHPGISEACNGVDEDCDDRTDEGTTTTCHADGDNDGFAPERADVREQCMSCTETDNWASAPRFPSEIDCDDTDAAVNPAATELCDDIDSNCSHGGVFPAPDEDGDQDGYADMLSPCSGGPLPKLDCNDRDSRARPNQTRRDDEPHCLGGAEIGCRQSNGTWSCAFMRDRDETCDTSAPVSGASAPSWDFNCDGTLDPEPPLTECQCTVSLCGEPPSGPGPIVAAGRSVGPGDPTTPADCGVEVFASYCIENGSCGSLGASCNVGGMSGGVHSVACL